MGRNACWVHSNVLIRQETTPASQVTSRQAELVESEDEAFNAPVLVHLVRPSFS